MDGAAEGKPGLRVALLHSMTPPYVASPFQVLVSA